MKSKIYVLLAIVMIAAMVAGIGCGPGVKPPSPEKPERVIKVWGWYDLSGPGAFLCVPASKGAEDTFKWIAEEKHIPGVKLEYLWSDHGYDISKATTQYKKYIADPDILFTIMAGSGIQEQLAPTMEQDKFVSFSLMSSAPMLKSKPTYAYSGGALFNDVLHGAMLEIKKEWKESRPPKVAYFYIEYSVGIGALPTYRRVTKELGWEAKAESCPVVPTDVTPQLKRIMDWGADYIYVGSFMEAAAVALNDANKLGIPASKFILSSAAVSTDLVRLTGKNAYGARGVYGLICFDPNGPNKMVKEWTQRAQAWHPGDKDVSPMLHTWYALGILDTKCLIDDALRRAVEAVGVENLTRENYNTYGMRSLKSGTFDAWGWAGSNVGLAAPDDQRFTTNQYMIRFVDKPPCYLEQASDWFFCPLSPDVE